MSAPNPATTEQGLDLLNALKNAFATYGLAEQVPGGIFLNVAGRTALSPYVVVKETGSASSFKTSTSTFRTVMLSFAVHGADLGVAQPLADAIEDRFKTTTYRFAGGFTGPLVEGEQTVDQPFGMRDAQSRDLWRVTVGFSVQVTRSRGLA